MASKVLMMSILLRAIRGSYRKDVSGKGCLTEIDEYQRIQRSQVWGYKVPRKLDLYTTMMYDVSFSSRATCLQSAVPSDVVRSLQYLSMCCSTCPSVMYMCRIM